MGKCGAHSKGWERHTENAIRALRCQRRWATFIYFCIFSLSLLFGSIIHSNYSFLTMATVPPAVKKRDTCQQKEQFTKQMHLINTGRVSTIYWQTPKYQQNRLITKMWSESIRSDVLWCEWVLHWISDGREITLRSCMCYIYSQCIQWNGLWICINAPS